MQQPTAPLLGGWDMTYQIITDRTGRARRRRVAVISWSVEVVLEACRLLRLEAGHKGWRGRGFDCSHTDQDL